MVVRFVCNRIVILYCVSYYITIYLCRKFWIHFNK